MPALHESCRPLAWTIIGGAKDNGALTLALARTPAHVDVDELRFMGGATTLTGLPSAFTTFTASVAGLALAFATGGGAYRSDSETESSSSIC